MTTIADVTQVLARAAIFDQRLARPSTAVVAGWAEEFAKHELELPDLLAGVSAYYAVGRDRVIQVGDVIKLARDGRQRRAQSENAEAARALPPGQPPRFTADGQVHAYGAPVTAAYQADGALDTACPCCHATPGSWCTSADGRADRKIPCLARLQAARYRDRRR